MNKPYDIVVIGSGMGGLCCAYILAKEGYSVCVLEKNRQLGGSLQIFSRDKVIFDTGIHYLGGLEEGQNLYMYFKYFGLMDKLKLLRMDMNGFDKITFGDDEKVYNHAQGYENFVNVLSEQFPGERDNIQRYANKIQEICNFFPLYRLGEDQKDLTTATFLDIDTKTYIESITSNIRLQNVLAGNNPLYAGEPYKTPLYVHALVVNTYIDSAWRCVDGGGQIAKLMAQSIKSMGGDIFNYSEACKFNFSGSEIKDVELTDGHRIEGKKFISDCDISKTLEMVEGGHIRQAYRNRINGLDNTVSTFILYIVLKKGSLRYFNHNLYHYRMDNVWDGMEYNDSNWPRDFCIFPQYSSRNPEYTDSLIVMSYMHYNEVSKWVNTKHIIPNIEQERGQAYEDFKEYKSQKVLEALYERMPEVKGKVVSYYSSSPLTYRDYIGSRDGTIYGIAKDYRNPLKTFITPQTRVPNLLLTGQNLNLHGVLGVTVSAVVTCATMVDQTYLVKKIKAAS